MTLSSMASHPWVALLAAGVFEVVWAVSMKASAGFTKPLYTTLTFVAAAISFWLLATAMKALPVGTAYAVWTGIGAVGAALLGMLLLREPATFARIACLALVVIGIAGLKLFEPDSPPG
jgi:quaternary ammonium compound-resistance protein SugE